MENHVLKKIGILMIFKIVNKTHHLDDYSYNYLLEGKFNENHLESVENSGIMQTISDKIHGTGYIVFANLMDAYSGSNALFCFAIYI
jgi:hypothetical protein